MGAPLLIVLAGPNGAGKSTFHESHLGPLGLPFLNADNLARETGLDVYTAARYQRSLENLGRAIKQLPRVRVYDNSSFRSPFRLLGEFRSGSLSESPGDPLPVWAQQFFTQVDN